MKLYFGLIAAALIFAGLSGAALSFDGSTYLFGVLESQRPYTPNDRLVNVPLHGPVLLVSRLTSDMVILRAAFGLIYAVIPLAALVLSWWVVRNRAPSLFVWPALCVGLGTLPGQFYLVSEGMYTPQLAWPIILSILLHLPRLHIPVIAFLAAAMLFAHPFAVVLFTFATGLLLASGWFYPNVRAKLWRWAFIFAIVLCIFVLRFATVKSGYENGQLSLDSLLRDFRTSVIGLPLSSLVFTWLAAMMIFSVPYVSKLGNRHLLLFVFFVELMAVVSAGLLLTLWASSSHYWIWASDFSPFALFNSLLFMSIASVESFLEDHKRTGILRVDWEHRTRTVQITAIMFFLVLATQSVTWLKVTDRLHDTMFQSSWSCTSMSSIAWLARTPLSWATPIYSILIQGRAPERIILPGNGCAEIDFTEGVHLSPFGVRSWNEGWFDLEPLKRQLAAERERTDGCWFMMSHGWYSAQEELNSNYWWRWSDGYGKLNIFVQEDTSVILEGEIESIQQPNTVTILINGKAHSTLDITWEKMGPLGPLTLPLDKGENIVEFVSHNPAIVVTANDRPLAIAVANLSLTIDDNDSVCDFHP